MGGTGICAEKKKKSKEWMLTNYEGNKRNYWNTNNLKIKKWKIRGYFFFRNTSLTLNGTVQYCIKITVIYVVYIKLTVNVMRIEFLLDELGAAI